MSQCLDLAPSGDAWAPKRVSVRLISSDVSVRKVEVLVDHRRGLSHVVHAEGDRFQITICTDSWRMALDFAYDLAGWTHETNRNALVTLAAQLVRRPRTK